MKENIKTFKTVRVIEELSCDWYWYLWVGSIQSRSQTHQTEERNIDLGGLILEPVSIDLGPWGKKPVISKGISLVRWSNILRRIPRKSRRMWLAVFPTATWWRTSGSSENVPGRISVIRRRVADSIIRIRRLNAKHFLRLEYRVECESSRGYKRSRKQQMVDLRNLNFNRNPKLCELRSIGHPRKYLGLVLGLTGIYRRPGDLQWMTSVSPLSGESSSAFQKVP